MSRTGYFFYLMTMVDVVYQIITSYRVIQLKLQYTMTNIRITNQLNCCYYFFRAVRLPDNILVL